MKKLMIAAAIVCAAAYAKAATYSWTAQSSTFMETDTEDGLGLEGLKVYVFDANQYALATFVDDAANGKLSTALGNALSINEGQNDTVADQMIFFSGTGIGDDGKDPAYINAYLAVIASANGKQYYETFEVSPIKVSEPVVKGGATLDIGEQYLTLPGGEGWVEVAPEPTSGLLLLIGVAGLALKRKRA